MSSDRRLDLAVAAFAVFVLSQGPVLTLWARHSPPWDAFAIPAATVTTFWMVHALVLFRWARAADGPGRAPVAIALFGATSTWLVLSTVWSTGPSATFTNAAGGLAVVATGWWLRSRMSTVAAIWAVWVGTVAGVLVSAIAIAIDAPFAVDPNGERVGIYGNRNSLAPVAMLAVLSSIALVVLEIDQRRSRDHAGPVPAMLTVAALLAGAGLSMWAVLVSGSLTSWFAAGAAATTAIAFAIAANRLSRRTLALGLVGAAAVLGVAFLLVGPLVSRALGRGSNFTSRGEIWDAAWTGYLQRPKLGWGFAAAWWDPEFRAPLSTNPLLEATIFEAHNGYLEVLVGGGPIALLLLFASLAASAVAIAGSGRPGTDLVEGWWWAGIAAFCVTANLQESFIGGNHLMWLLLVASGAGVGGREDRAPTQWPRSTRTTAADAA
jgi:O-antigen ligase